jgi:hypothetical protein
MFSVNNTDSMKAARKALEELFTGRFIPTIVYEFERYENPVHEPSSSRRVVRYLQTNPSKGDPPEVYVFVGHHNPNTEVGEPELDTQKWEPYEAWVYTPGWNYAVFNRVDKVGIQPHWVLTGHQATPLVEMTVQPPPLPPRLLIEQ